MRPQAKSFRTFPCMCLINGQSPGGLVSSNERQPNICVSLFCSCYGFPFHNQAYESERCRLRRCHKVAIQRAMEISSLLLDL